jgi:molecular chaperone Hsp33
MNELQTFLLEGQGIRGALVRLEETWQQVIAEHQYPPPLRRLLGEGVAATVLLSSALKDQPRVSLQLQSEGPLKLLLIQCSALHVGALPHGLKVRGMAQCGAVAQGEALLSAGRLAVNLDTGAQNGFFQGIVPLVSSELDACLEAYFRQSEQLPTRLVLRSGAMTAGTSAFGSSALSLLDSAERRVAGLLLQALPGGEAEPAVFEHAAALARAVATEELNVLPAKELLPKVFDVFDIRLFESRPVLHDCRCTPDHLARVVRLLGVAELESLLADRGAVELTCEFCNRAFRYDDDGIEAVLRGESPGPALH